MTGVDNARSHLVAQTSANFQISPGALAWASQIYYIRGVGNCPDGWMCTNRVVGLEQFL